MKRGKAGKLTLHAVAAPEQPVTLALSLTGFTAAYDSLEIPTVPAAAAPAAAGPGPRGSDPGAGGPDPGAGELSVGGGAQPPPLPSSRAIRRGSRRSAL